MPPKTKKPKQKRPKRKLRLMHCTVPEKKHYDTHISQTMGWGGLLVSLDNPAIGTGDQQRIGNEIYVKSILMRSGITMPSGAAYSNCRVLILRDLQGMNTPAVHDVLDPTTLNTPSAPYSLMNRGYATRFRVLADAVISMNQSGGQIASYIRFIKGGFKTRFVGGSTFTNQLYVLFINDFAISSTSPTFMASVRVDYYDN